MNRKKALCLAASAALVLTVLPAPFHAAFAETEETKPTEEQSAPTETAAPAETAVPTETAAATETTEPAETTAPTETEPADETEKSQDIVILYTNDIHCGVDQGVGLDGVKLYKREMEAQYENVFLVDAGDSIQGSPLGMLTKGKDVIALMNAVGYDVCVPGNHDFDYGVETIQTLAKELDCGYTCCNFADLRNDSLVFRPYRMFNAGGKKIAFVGVTTPVTLTNVTPKFFTDDNGKYIYSFAGQEEALYQTVQYSVDAARDADADYVILVGHLGETDDVVEKWSAMEVAEHTRGIDAIIDGHSHEETLQLISTSLDGKQVTITQTGTKLQNLGKMVIEKDGTITTELLNTVPEPDASMGLPESSYQQSKERGGHYVDKVVQQKTEEIIGKMNAELSEKIGSTAYTLYEKDPDTGKRFIRWQETNAGDFCTDAYRLLMDADAAFLNSGGIRASIQAGDITYYDLMNVMPYGNTTCVAELTGQQILDMLEYGAMKYPEEHSGLLQVSGIHYAINPDVESGIVLDDMGNVTAFGDTYRVHSVMIGNEPLDPDKLYTVASSSYLLKTGGDHGILANGVKSIYEEPYADNEMLAMYLEKILEGEVPELYADMNGTGRIQISSEPVNWLEIPGAFDMEGLDMSMLPEGFDMTMLPENVDIMTLLTLAMMGVDISQIDFSKIPEDFDWSTIPEDFDWTLIMKEQEKETNYSAYTPPQQSYLRIPFLLTPRQEMTPTPVKDTVVTYPVTQTYASGVTPVTPAGSSPAVIHAPTTADHRPIGLAACLSGAALAVMALLGVKKRSK